MSDNLILKIDDLWLKYGDKEAVKGVSLSVRRGDTVALAGESGSGKTSLLKSIMGIANTADISCKSMVFDSLELNNLSYKERQKAVKGKISFMFQNSENSLDPVRTVGYQFAECVRSCRKVSKRQALDEAKKLLSDFNFDDPERVLRSYPFELSGGMCQRVSAALAMVNEPLLLLADEPTSSLDGANRSRMIDELLALKKKNGTSIVMATHDIAAVRSAADFVGVMLHGRLIEWGNCDQVLGNPAHPYTKLLLNSVVPYDKRIGGTDICLTEKIVTKNNRVSYSFDHWALEAEIL